MQMILNTLKHANTYHDSYHLHNKNFASGALLLLEGFFQTIIFL